jgi:hypothetical protein
LAQQFLRSARVLRYRGPALNQAMNRLAEQEDDEPETFGASQRDRLRPRTGSPISRWQLMSLTISYRFSSAVRRLS